MPRNVQGPFPSFREQPENLDDISLVDRCLRGQPAAWQLLIERHGPSVHDAASYTLRRVLGSPKPDDVENVVQGVFLGLCEKSFHRLRLFQARSSFRTWVTSVTTRFALNYIRTEKRKGSLKFAALDDEAGMLPDRDPSNALPPDELDRLFRGLERLSPRERLLLKLFYFENLSYREISKALRMPVNSISPMLARARETLKSFYSS